MSRCKSLHIIPAELKKVRATVLLRPYPQASQREGLLRELHAAEEGLEARVGAQLTLAISSSSLAKRRLPPKRRVDYSKRAEGRWQEWLYRTSLVPPFRRGSCHQTLGITCGRESGRQVHAFVRQPHV